MEVLRVLSQPYYIHFCRVFYFCINEYFSIRDKIHTQNDQDMPCSWGEALWFCFPQFWVSFCVLGENHRGMPTSWTPHSFGPPHPSKVLAELEVVQGRSAGTTKALEWLQNEKLLRKFQPGKEAIVRRKMQLKSKKSQTQSPVQGQTCSSFLTAGVRSNRCRIKYEKKKENLKCQSKDGNLD